jgi:hypothetical protein
LLVAVALLLAVVGYFWLRGRQAPKDEVAREVELQRGAEDVLVFRERKQYLAAVQEALAGADAARVVLAGVVKAI